MLFVILGTHLKLILTVVWGSLQDLSGSQVRVVSCKAGNEHSDSQGGGQHLNDRSALLLSREIMSLVQGNSLLEQLHAMCTKRRYAYINRSEPNSDNKYNHLDVRLLDRMSLPTYSETYPIEWNRVLVMGNIIINPLNTELNPICQYYK